jgi:hypothetical protein
MRKDVFVNLSMDKGTAHLLAVLADNESEGNRSAAMRLAVRESAAKRGLVLPESGATPVYHEGKVGVQP